MSRSFLKRLGDMKPAPLAGPETPELRAARLRLITASLLAVFVFGFFGVFRALFGMFALPLAAALFVFLAVQGWGWVRAKNRADDAFLLQGRNDDD